MEFAFGFLNITPEVFWSMTRREFFNAANGYWKRKEQENRADNERARAIAYTVYCGIPKEKGKRNEPIERFWPLKKLTEEEKQQLKNKRLEAQKMFEQTIDIDKIKEKFGQNRRHRRGNKSTG